jgi:hypothetical protein
MSRTEARKAVKGAAENVLSIAQSTRSKTKTTRSKSNNIVLEPVCDIKKTRKASKKAIPSIDVDELLRR